MSVGGRHGGGPVLRAWVTLQIAASRMADGMRALAADRDELERRLMAVAIPVAVILCQGAVLIIVESLVVMVSSLRGIPLSDTIRSLPASMSAWGLPIGCLGVLMPLLFRGVRTMVSRNHGFGWRHAHSLRGVAGSIGIGAAVGLLMWLFSSLASSMLRLAGVDIPAMGRSTMAALHGPLVIAVAVVASPVAEELLFRGVVSRSLMRSRLLTGADGSRTRPARIMISLLAGLSFGIMHMDGSADGAWLAMSVAWMTVFGAVQTMLADRRGLDAAIVSHICYNCAAVAAVSFL